MAKVRDERAGDAAAIRSVHLASFPTPTEADLVEQVRRDGDTAVSVVAEDDGKIVGHILLSNMSVEADGQELRGLGLAPLAVLPDRQRTGIGSAMIDAAIERARSLRAQIVFVLGEPTYYCRFGFYGKIAAPFASPYAGPYFQARFLDDLPQPSTGRADYASAFADLQ